jgi:hypothetical protein
LNEEIGISIIDDAAGESMDIMDMLKEKIGKRG